MTDLADLADFLLARLAEDEEAARVATQGNEHYPRWTAEPNMRLEPGCRCLSCWEPVPGSWDVYPIDGPDCEDHGCHHTMTIGEADAKHIARHDPARVLAEVNAKRQLIEHHEGVPYPNPTDAPVDLACTGDGKPRYPDECPTLRLLALPYADHPDYRQEWRP